MPAIITHDSFGQDVYKLVYTDIGESRDEFEAFLLGNQGPDPLFFGVLVPSLRTYASLGTTMHDDKPNELLKGFQQSLSVLDEHELPIGRAYLDGFLCHYLLDSTVHPLVFYYEKQLCDAGIDELDRSDKHEVHAVIETELDEMILYTKQSETVATFNPSTEILRASKQVLEIVSKMYVFTAMTVYAAFIPQSMFAVALRAYRSATAAFYSKNGVKRLVAGKIEQLFRRYSFFSAMSHRPREVSHSSFDNHEHLNWENPFTGQTSNDSFDDLYNAALIKAQESIELINQDSFSLEDARSITADLDFSGQPTVALLTVEEGA